MYRLANLTPVLAFLVVLCLALPTAAQEQDQPASQATTKPFYTRGPLFTIQLAGPKAMGQAVLPTNLGTLLSSPECKPVRDLVRLIVQGILSEARTENAQDAWTVLESRLLAYAGRVDVEFHVTNREVRNKAWVRYDVAGHLLLWPDGSTDMARLSQEMRAFLLAVSRETPNTKDLGDGRECEFFGRAHDDGISLPMKHGTQGDYGDALVLFFGSRIGKAITGGLTRLGKSSEAHARRDKAWRKTPGQLGKLDVDMVQVAALIADEFRRHKEEAQLVHKFLGTESWERAGANIRTAGPQILIEATMDYKPGRQRGMFGGLLPDITTLPKLAWLTPHGTDEKPAAFLAAHVRVDKLYNLFLEVMGNLFRRSKMRTLDEIKAEVRKEMGFDFEADLLAHLSTEVLGLLQIDEDAERDRAAPDADGLCFVMRITNKEGFEATYKKLKAHRNLRPGEPKEIEGGEATPIRGPAGGDYIGRTDKLFFYAVGDRGLEVMKAFLRQNAKAGDQPALPKVVQRVFRNTPAGWNAVGVLAARWLQDPMMESVLWEIWREVDDIFPREVRRTMTREMLVENAGKAAPILKKYRMDRVVLFGGWEPKAAGAPDNSRARLRLLW